MGLPVTEFTKAFLKPRLKVGRESVVRAQTKEQVMIMMIIVMIMMMVIIIERFAESPTIQNAIIIDIITAIDKDINVMNIIYL